MCVRSHIVRDKVFSTRFIGNRIVLEGDFMIDLKSTRGQEFNARRYNIMFTRHIENNPTTVDIMFRTFLMLDSFLV